MDVRGRDWRARPGTSRLSPLDLFDVPARAQPPLPFSRESLPISYAANREEQNSPEPQKKESVVGGTPAMSGPLSEEEDAFGRLLLDYLAGEAGQLILELDDGRAGPALPTDVFFAEHREWPAQEQQVFEFVHGTRSRCRLWSRKAQPRGAAARAGSRGARHLSGSASSKTWPPRLGGSLLIS
jgi:hypothetical protein